MTSALEWFAHKVGAWRAGPVRRSAAAHGGKCTQPFSQCCPPVLGLISADPLTSGGVCEALSANWIYHHATGGSLWNELLTANGDVVVRKLEQIRQLQAYGLLTAHGQDAATRDWLESQGMQRRESNFVLNPSRPERQMGGATIPPKEFEGGSLPKSQTGATSLFERNDLARAIIEDDTGGAGVYKLLGLSGRAGDHAMAVWVGQDVVFFDPNFGELWFPSRSGFFNWFTQAFWHKSSYSVGLSGSYQLLHYAKANA